jgi:hypothetical protein
LSCRRASLIQGLPFPQSQPFPSSPLLRSCLPSHSNKVGTASVLSLSPPPIQGLSGPLRASPLPPPLFFSTFRAAIPRTFSHPPSSFCQCFFHIISPRCMLTSRFVTQISLSFKIAQSLECLNSIAYLDLAVAPRLSSLRKIRTQRIQYFKGEAFSDRIPLRLNDNMIATSSHVFLLLSLESVKDHHH